MTFTTIVAGEIACRKSHIPGARYAHLERDLSSPKTAVADAMGLIGVSRKPAQQLWTRRGAGRDHHRASRSGETDRAAETKKSSGNMGQHKGMPVSLH